MFYLLNIQMNITHLGSWFLPYAAVQPIQNDDGLSPSLGTVTR